jgi:diguanylate cyclase (GGDEF)-like protein
MRTSTLPTMISRLVATRSHTTGALGRVSGRRETGTWWRRCATRRPRNGFKRRRIAIEWPTIAIERPSFVIGAVRDVIPLPVCTIWRMTPAGVEKMFLCGPSAIAVAPRPIAQRRPTIASGLADDRRRAADDRAEAARERADAQRNQAEASDALTEATTDDLTGAWVRKFGLAEVARELERAARTGAKLVLAFIDVDGLKEVNNKRGHLAGDALLRLVGDTIRDNIRGYDVLVRYGGDELLCAMPNITVSEAQERFEQIGAALSAAGTHYSVTFGLAEAEPTDSLRDLIGRADDALLEARSSES